MDFIGRRVESRYHGIVGTVAEWFPAGPAMIVRVQRDDGSSVWVASRDLVPLDGKGPLPKRADGLCTNCGDTLPTSHGCEGPEGHRFCDHCAGIAEALAIGARMPVVLYESDKAHSGALGPAAKSWTGQTLGYVIRKTVPYWTRNRLDPRDSSGRRMFCPVRFRVRMLDGSMWHGSGPTSNGTYIKLRPMKGE